MKYLRTVLAALGLLIGISASHAADPAPLRIGIIGTGNIGGTLAAHWARAGHQLMISGLDADALRPLAAQLGKNVRVGTPREAAAFGEVVLISVPYKALPQIGADYKSELAGKVVVDTCNPYPQRDGDMAVEARKLGSGVTSRRYLPGVKLVRAFNAISYVNLREQSRRAGSLIAIPIAADDASAVAVGSRLVRDAGFEPVVVGGLSEAKRFDPDTPVYVKLMNAAGLREALQLH